MRTMDAKTLMAPTGEDARAKSGDAAADRRVVVAPCCRVADPAVTRGKASLVSADVVAIGIRCGIDRVESIPPGDGG